MQQMQKMHEILKEAARLTDFCTSTASKVSTTSQVQQCNKDTGRVVAQVVHAVCAATSQQLQSAEHLAARGRGKRGRRGPVRAQNEGEEEATAVMQGAIRVVQLLEPFLVRCLRNKVGLATSALEALGLLLSALIGEIHAQEVSKPRRSTPLTDHQPLIVGKAEWYALCAGAQAGVQAWQHNTRFNNSKSTEVRAEDEDSRGEKGGWQWLSGEAATGLLRALRKGLPADEWQRRRAVKHGQAIVASVEAANLSGALIAEMLLLLGGKQGAPEEKSTVLALLGKARVLGVASGNVYRAAWLAMGMYAEARALLEPLMALDGVSLVFLDKKVTLPKGGRSHDPSPRRRLHKSQAGKAERVPGARGNAASGVPACSLSNVSVSQLGARSFPSYSAAAAAALPASSKVSAGLGGSGLSEHRVHVDAALEAPTSSDKPLRPYTAGASPGASTPVHRGVGGKKGEGVRQRRWRQSCRRAQVELQESRVQEKTLQESDIERAKGVQRGRGVVGIQKTQCVQMRARDALRDIERSGNDLNRLHSQELGRSCVQVRARDLLSTRGQVVESDMESTPRVGVARETERERGGSVMSSQTRAISAVTGKRRRARKERKLAQEDVVNELKARGLRWERDQGKEKASEQKSNQDRGLESDERMQPVSRSRDPWLNASPIRAVYARGNDGGWVGGWRERERASESERARYLLHSDLQQRSPRRDTAGSNQREQYMEQCVDAERHLWPRVSGTPFPPRVHRESRGEQQTYTPMPPSLQRESGREREEEAAAFEGGIAAPDMQSFPQGPTPVWGGGGRGFVMAPHAWIAHGSDRERETKEGRIGNGRPVQPVQQIEKRVHDEREWYAREPRPFHSQRYDHVWRGGGGGREAGWEESGRGYDYSAELTAERWARGSGSGQGQGLAPLEQHGQRMWLDGNVMEREWKGKCQILQNLPMESPVYVRKWDDSKTRPPNTFASNMRMHH